MFSLKSALTWGIGLVLGLSLVAGLNPNIRALISQALTQTEARVEGALGFAEQSSASASTESPAQSETGTQLPTGVEVQTGVGVNVSAGNTSATIGTEAGVSAGAEATRQSNWSLKSLFYKLTHLSLNAQAEANP